jgi:thymidylate synthase (FAD)
VLNPTIDYKLTTTTIAATPKPQTLVWLAMHQCYSSEPTEELGFNTTEAEYGAKAVQHLLVGNRGHYSPLEAPSISLRMTYVPHSVVQQLRTHRHLSFSVQSFRYTSSQFLKYVDNNPLTVSETAIDELVYVGNDRRETYKLAHDAIHEYAYRVLVLGEEPDQARGILPFDLRQHAVVSGNLRAWWHLLDVRLKPDVQPQFQQLALQVRDQLRLFVPQLQAWYDSKRATKAILSP